MAQVQTRLAEKSLLLVEAIDAEHVAKAPLNQLASTLGVLIDRYLKLTDDHADMPAEQVIRFEYVYPEGTVASTPPWSADDSEQSGAVSGGGVRTTLRQDRTRQVSLARQGIRSGAANMVARPHLSDGESSVAGLEDDDAERLWDFD
jgi:hypothetical protein